MSPSDAPRAKTPPAPEPPVTGPSPLLPILEVEQIEQDYFRGAHAPGGKGRAFGGLVVAQALMAATGTVDEARHAHSLHAYFMRPGDAAAPVLYRVERDRDGKSFDTRRVIAIQNGRPILNLAASFHAPEPGLSHQTEMPDVPDPEGLPTDADLAREHYEELPERYLQFFRWNRPVEIRPVMTRPPYKTDDLRPINRFWFRAKGEFPGDARLHRAALAFASDMGLLGAAMMPHAKHFAAPEMQVASLDHALWLHADFRADDWLLYDIDSPWAGGARGFTRGRIFSRDGRLVADAAQEGLVRVHEEG
ncbi:acyl-CoA thioesterase [Rhodovulum sp. DZ06]|uniref:acyl-CoA thioesterase n=1 Tax=Rhodovulum sp. DZ06 TaxID=3425126 RepID=UPI003D3538D9